MKVCSVGAAGRLGKYMVRQALDRGLALIMVEALDDDALVHEAPASVSRISAAARAHTVDDTSPQPRG